MRLSKYDKVVTIRFNVVEIKKLNFLVNYCAIYPGEPVGAVIKRILFEEYERKTGS